eukprot:TRINITY_DN2713_c0_g1_i1.p1 TRINITY_DN2713_c0_g1~~TRINITY_DN2713_c0_g1_i1.p1  ORF type:complete len:462 (-),score=67.91 TRINITY_DN2713_c0_g1_i1:109-1494(-)
MVKLKTICRDEKKYNKEKPSDMQRMYRNPNGAVHPLQKAREYKRALNAAKLERIFAKPFLYSLDGHHDGINVLAKNPTKLAEILSGSYDGEVRVWNLTAKTTIYSMLAHEGIVSGLSYIPGGDKFVSSGDDKILRLWSLTDLEKQKCNWKPTTASPNAFKTDYKAHFEYTSKESISSVHCHFNEPLFATGGSVVQIWNYERSSPVESFDWGVDSVIKVRFNPSETNLLLGTSLDRSIILYDIKGNTPLKKVTLKNKSNAICWNPYEPINFTIGNEDGNAYTFDMRKLDQAKMIHKDHISGILDLDYAPTGREFVTGGFDKSIRIFNSFDGRSREVYHTRRMQQIYSVLYTMDNRYVISGSDDTNVRVWKSNASDPLKPLLPREKERLAYCEKLKKKYFHNKEIRRILRHRHLPKFIWNKNRKKQIQKNAKFRKEDNIRMNAPPGTLEYIPEKQAKIADTEE